MKIVIYGWLVVVALITGLNTAVANTDDGMGAGSEGHQVINGQIAAQSMAPSSSGVHVAASQSVQRRLVQVPAALIDRLAVEAIQVGDYRGQPIKLKQIQVSKKQVKIIGHRLITDQGPGRLQPAFWLEEIRVTFPRHYIAGSWDVQALQRELERLGIKVKPKPAEPKPSVQQLSG